MAKSTRSHWKGSRVLARHVMVCHVHQDLLEPMWYIDCVGLVATISPMDDLVGCRQFERARQYATTDLNVLSLRCRVAVGCFCKLEYLRALAISMGPSPMLPMLIFSILLAGSHFCIRSEDLTSGVVSNSYKRALHLKLRTFIPM